MKYQTVDEKILQRSASSMSPYNIEIEDFDLSYECRLSFFEVCMFYYNALFIDLKEDYAYFVTCAIHINRKK